MLPCFRLGSQSSHKLPRPGRSRLRLQDPLPIPAVRLRGPMGRAHAPNTLSILHVTASKWGVLAEQAPSWPMCMYVPSPRTLPPGNALPTSYLPRATTRASRGCPWWTAQACILAPIWAPATDAAFRCFSVQIGCRTGRIAKESGHVAALEAGKEA